MASKFTTGLVGLAVEANPRKKLNILFTSILEELSVMPASTAYRKYMEKFTQDRLQTVNNTTDLEQLELKLNAGQLEEVIETSKSELKLARRMNKWKAWEPLLSQPPEGQWTWP